MTITYKYFFEEYHRFREIMCSTAYTLKQKLNALEGLLTVYVCIDETDKEKEALVVKTMEALKAEVDKRIGYEAVSALVDAIGAKDETEAKEWKKAIAAALF